MTRLKKQKPTEKEEINKTSVELVRIIHTTKFEQMKYLFSIFTTLIILNGMTQNVNKKSIVLGGGCFWCIEAVFNMTEGVTSAVSGYAGGATKDPTYDEVCSGSTGHAEVVKLTYNSEIISLNKILDVFFTIHDPSQLNKQGADVGTQYRSIILYNTIEEKTSIDDFIKNLINTDRHDKVVTEVKQLATFYPAELSHQDYYERNQFAPYCSYVIKPKVRTFKSKYKDLIKQ